MKKLTLVLILIALIFAGFFIYQKDNTDSLTFSNTAKWGEHLLDEMEVSRSLLDEWNGKFDIPNPSSNSSNETKSEVVYLIELKDKRTEEKVAEIELEAYNYNFPFAGRDFMEYFDEDEFPETSWFYQDLLDITTIVLQEKERFDRVRPSVLEPKINPIIDIPMHPAYPSGHATQAYFLAELFSILDPGRSEEFFNEAYRIAHNREIAGVHYPSDSEAGSILAKQYVEMRMSDFHFSKQIEKAKEEWSN